MNLKDLRAKRVYKKIGTVEIYDINFEGNIEKRKELFSTVSKYMTAIIGIKKVSSEDMIEMGKELLIDTLPILTSLEIGDLSREEQIDILSHPTKQLIDITNTVQEIIDDSIKAVNKLVKSDMEVSKAISELTQKDERLN